MKTFLSDVLDDILKKAIPWEDCVFILPNQRARVFLKALILQKSNKTSFAPTISTIEEFAQNLSELSEASKVQLLFEFYAVYKEITPKEDQEAFDSFVGWANVLLQDFNEIDQNQAPHQELFSYTGAIQEINHWALQKEQTPLAQSYLRFWTQLPRYYEEFKKRLISKGMGYQGLVYREALENLEYYVEHHTEKQHFFLGFNALNKAEERLIQELLHRGLADVFWDTDDFFMKDKEHNAGSFMRAYRKGWPFYRRHPFKWSSSNFTEDKHIRILGTPKRVGQVKAVGQCLEDMSIKKSDYQDVAVVLGDESLLIPLLNSIPRKVQSLNVTMGYPLGDVPLAALFQKIFRLHQHIKPRGFYHKEVIALLTEPSLKFLWSKEDGGETWLLIQYIHKHNLIYLTKEELSTVVFSRKGRYLLDLLFTPWGDDAEQALNSCQELILALRSVYDSDRQGNALQLEYLYRFHQLFGQLLQYHTEYGYLNNLKSLIAIYKRLLKQESLDFQGEPLHGLQIMGLLESRVLDFGTVIITSVNEGILPGGRSSPSFIPFDVKKHYGLPTYQERDAVFAYHFYRLLHRAKHIYLIYNTETDVLGSGEKSRFIRQLEIQGSSNHQVNHKVIGPMVPKIDLKPTVVAKTPSVMQRIEEVAQRGFSPSSLTTYIRNPLDFYYGSILGVQEYDEVEETMAANTLGTAIHNTLETLYKPLEDKYIEIQDLNGLEASILNVLTSEFSKVYGTKAVQGKNLILQRVAERYLVNFIRAEKNLIEKGHRLKILYVESEYTIPFPTKPLPFPIFLRGKVDRVDELDGVIRIIDYKTGMVKASQVSIYDWSLLTTNYEKYSKSVQLLTYAYMFQQEERVKLPLKAGIISFRNLKEGFLPFKVKETAKSRKADERIGRQTLRDFENVLKDLILEICNPEIPFIERTILPKDGKEK